MFLNAINFKFTALFSFFICLWLWLIGQGFWWVGLLVVFLLILISFSFALLILAQANKAALPDNDLDTGGFPR